MSAERYAHPTSSQVGRERAAAMAQRIKGKADVLDIAKLLLAGWDAYPPNETIAECLNETELWDALRAAIAKAGGK